MQNNIAQFINSPANLQRISTEIFVRAQQNFGITLDENFKTTLMNVVGNVLQQFGHKTVKMTDAQHLEALNKMIVEECLKIVSQYRNTMGNQVKKNPFADFASENKLNGDNMAQIVDNLRAARGYSIPNESTQGAPRIDFSEPMQDRRLNSDDFTKKIEAERGIFNNNGYGMSGGVALNEIMGTPKPLDVYTGNGTSVKDEYTKRLATIKGRDGNDSLPVDLPKGSSANGHHNGHNGGHNGQVAGDINGILGSSINGQPLSGTINSINGTNGIQGSRVPTQGNGNNNYYNGPPPQGQNVQTLQTSQTPQTLQTGQTPQTSQTSQTPYTANQQQQQQQQLLQQPQQQQQQQQQQQMYRSQMMQPMLTMNIGMRLCLDMRRSLESKTSTSYILRFPRIQNCQAIQLNSCITPGYRGLVDEATIGLRIENLPTRYGNTNLFSRLSLEKEINGFFHFKPEEDTPLPYQDSLSYLEVSFRTWDDQAINLDSIDVDQIMKNTKNGTMKVICRQPHHLVVGDFVTFQLDDKTAERLETLKVSDDMTFVTQIPDKMTGHITILRIFPRVTLNFTVYQNQ